MDLAMMEENFFRLKAKYGHSINALPYQH